MLICESNVVMIFEHYLWLLIALQFQNYIVEWMIMMKMIYNSWCLWGWWWLWCCGDDDDVNENDKGKRWCPHIAFVHSLTCILCPTIILCCDTTSSWIWLTMNTHEYRFLFPLKWNLINVYLSLISIMLIALHLFDLSICMVSCWVDLWCFLGLIEV